MSLFRLDNHVCFKLYALSRQITCAYRPLLDEINLTYPQYLAMVLLWEKGHATVKEMGQQLYLDSGTLTPLLKRLEEKELVHRSRSHSDERIVEVSVTDTGKALKTKAMAIPLQLSKELPFTAEEMKALMKQVNGLLAKIS